MTKEILLTRGMVAIVDDIDYDYLSQFKWCAHYTGWNWYAERGVHVNGKQIVICMHHVVLGVANGVMVDHKNGDGLTNTRGNLRVATTKENSRNRGAGKNNTSGYKGVVWHKRVGKWNARITVDYKKIHLGYYDTAEEAAYAYDTAARELHGEFARLNLGAK